jgi:hypothetical protein
VADLGSALEQLERDGVRTTLIAALGGSRIMRP